MIKTAAAPKNRNRAVPQPQPKADRDRAVRTISTPRMTIKGNPVGMTNVRMPEISRPIAGRTMF